MKLPFKIPKTTSSLKLKFKIPNSQERPSSGIKLKFRVPVELRSTTESNGITKNVTQKRLRIKFNLAPEDRLSIYKENQLRRLMGVPTKPTIKFNLAPEDRLPIDEENQLRHFIGVPAITNSIKCEPKETDRSTLKLKLKFKPLFSQRPLPTLKLCPEKQYRPMDVDNEASSTTNPESGTNNFLAALEANSRLCNSTDDREISNKPTNIAVAISMAERILDMKPRIANLMRMKDEYGKTFNRSARIEKSHVLRAIPVHMRILKRSGEPAKPSTLAQADITMYEVERVRGEYNMVGVEFRMNRMQEVIEKYPKMIGNNPRWEESQLRKILAKIDVANLSELFNNATEKGILQQVAATLDIADLQDVLQEDTEQCTIQQTLTHIDLANISEIIDHYTGIAGI
jgi:hypothetical protein